jgi:asparagine synthase (glutamine-hydrolysing)
VPATVVSPELIPSDKRFHTDAIHRAFPEHAHLPYEDKQALRLSPALHDQQFAREAGRFIVRNMPFKPHLLNRSYVLPRAAYASVVSAFGRARPWFAGMSLHLTQLEMILEGRFPSSIGIESDADAGWQQAS